MHAMQEMIATLGILAIYSPLGSPLAYWRIEKKRNTRRCVITAASMTCCVGDNFLFNIVTDESWSHNLDPETKRQSMVWHHTTSRKEKQARTVPLYRQNYRKCLLCCRGVNKLLVEDEKGNHQRGSLRSDAERTATRTSWQAPSYPSTLQRTTSPCTSDIGDSLREWLGIVPAPTKH
jgi:hypothetical protein